MSCFPGLMKRTGETPVSVWMAARTTSLISSALAQTSGVIFTLLPRVSFLILFLSPPPAASMYLEYKSHEVSASAIWIPKAATVAAGRISAILEAEGCIDLYILLKYAGLG